MKYVASICVLMAALITARADGQPARSEAELQAAYVYQFFSYLSWPKGAGNQLVIGVWSNESMLGHFQKVVEERNTKSRVVQVVELKNEEVPEEVDIVFAEKLRPQEFEVLVKAAEGRSFVIVSPFEAHFRRGASIYLFLDSGKLRFSVSRKHLESRGVKASSQLLRLAKQVD